MVGRKNSKTGRFESFDFIEEDSTPIDDLSVAAKKVSTERTDVEILREERGEKEDFNAERITLDSMDDPAQYDTEGEGEIVQVGDDVQSMGSFIEYTISNKLNQASHGSVLERIWAYKDILVLLSPYVECIGDRFKDMMSMKTALDDMMDQAGFKFGTSYKRMMFIRNGDYKRYSEEKYLAELENLAMAAIREATAKRIISLQEAQSGYNMVVFDQGGGFRPQPRRSGY